MKKIHFNEIYDFHKAVLCKAGLDEHTCESVSFGLCETSLRGVDSHGIRLLPHYTRSAFYWVERIQHQSTNSNKCFLLLGI